MRIIDSASEGRNSAPSGIQERVEEIFLYTLKISELKNLMAEIRKESIALRDLFWTEEEQNQKTDSVNFFDARMQAMVYYTFRNLEEYQQNGWKELIDEGGKPDEAAEVIPTNQ